MAERQGFEHLPSQVYYITLVTEIQVIYCTGIGQYGAPFGHQNQINYEQKKSFEKNPKKPDLKKLP